MLMNYTKTHLILNNGFLLQTFNRTYAKAIQKFPNKTYIGGKWVEASHQKTYEVRNPSTRVVLGSVPDCDTAEIDLAVTAARRTFKTWSATTAEYRSKLLKKLAQLYTENKKLAAELIVYENGKPMADALLEIESTIKAYEWYAEECKRVYGDIIPAPALNKRFLVIKQPTGVCGFITPWNFPASMVARKASASLAAGCTAIIKPAKYTPYSALLLCQFAEEAGIPAGALNILTTSTENEAKVGKELCVNDYITNISFTGSTNVGKIILENCASHVKKTELESGGNAPFIVFSSANLDKAVDGLIASKFRCSGQTCICANRILVQSDIYDEFIEKFARAIKERLYVGDGFDEKSTQGPLINFKAVKRVNHLIDDAVKKGAKLLLGGKQHALGGTFYEPTLITDVQLNMEIAVEEIFGPVAAIMKFDTEEEALKIANSSPVGLAGYFFSENISQVWRVAEKLQLGMVGVNDSSISTIEAPFGGVKQSGFGSEGSKYGIEEFLNIKYICMGNLQI